MAVRALRERHRLLEITSRVALQAIHLLMFPDQRIPGLGMIKLLAGRNLLPTGGGVAGFTGLRESAAMRVGVAIGTLAERDTRKPRRASGCCRRMALRAWDLRMEAGQRKSRLGVIDLGGCLPIGETVALQAVLSQLAVMDIFMARHTVL